MSFVIHFETLPDTGREIIYIHLVVDGLLPLVTQTTERQGTVINDQDPLVFCKMTVMSIH